MAAVTRTPSTGAPSATIAGAPVFSRQPSATGLYTGTIAVPRDQPRDSTGAFIFSETQKAALDHAQELAATQRVQRAGLGSEAIPIVRDYYNETGRWPDLSVSVGGVSGGAGAPGGKPGGGVTEAGVFGGMSPTVLAIGAAALLAGVLIFGKRIK